MRSGCVAAATVSGAMLLAMSCEDATGPPDVEGPTVSDGASENEATEDGGAASPDGDDAVALCTGLGRKAASRMADDPVVDKVFRTSAAGAAAWRDSIAHPDSPDSWGELDPEMLVAVCHYGARQIYAPGGPPAPDDARTSPEHDDGYDVLVLLVGADGTIDYAQARDTDTEQSDGSRGDTPPGAERVR